MTLDFKTVTADKDALWRQRQGERKWGPAIRSLMAGETIFVGEMTRSQLETLRSILRDKGIVSLRSKTVTNDGVEGRILRLR